MASLKEKISTQLSEEIRRASRQYAEDGTGRGVAQGLQIAKRIVDDGPPEGYYVLVDEITPLHAQNPKLGDTCIQYNYKYKVVRGDKGAWPLGATHEGHYVWLPDLDAVNDFIRTCKNETRDAITRITNQHNGKYNKPLASYGEMYYTSFVL